MRSHRTAVAIFFVATLHSACAFSQSKQLAESGDHGVMANVHDQSNLAVDPLPSWYRKLCPNTAELYVQAMPEDQAIGGVRSTLGFIPLLIGCVPKTDEHPAGRNRCSGVVLGDRWVLTAGHCKDEVQFVIIGTNQVGGAEIPIISLVKHFHLPDNYAENPVDNDIGLIELKEPLPARIPRIAVGPSSRATTGLFAGWGRHEDDGIGIELRQVGIEEFAGSECARMSETRPIGFERFSVTPGLAICAGTRQAGACLGDSGGPFLVLHDGSYFVVAIASRSACKPALGGLDGRGVFVVVDRFLPWIAKVTGRSLSELQGSDEAAPVAMETK